MNELRQILEQEIGARGPIPFARFMELALYHPEFGYYESSEDRVGQKGDFYTSVSVGSLFGELLAFRFAGWLSQLNDDGEDRAVLVECGAHHGQLAWDILSWLKKSRPSLYEGLQYWIIEPSPRRRGWQQSKLAVFTDRVRWASNWEELMTREVAGVFFSNELLDAFPARRIGWSAGKKQWFEWGVGSEQGQFLWQRLDLAGGTSDSVFLAIGRMQAPDSLLDILPDGFTTEINPNAEAWWQHAANTLSRGWLLTLDYGLTTDEFLTPQRVNGTLRAYHRHHIADDLLANPGQQDLTAHVHFDAIRRVGESDGLRTESFCSQSHFLTEIFSEAIKPENRFGNWTADRTRQFQTLTHPEHLGRPFKVLVQRR